MSPPLREFSPNDQHHKDFGTSMRGPNANVSPEELSAEDLCRIYIQTRTKDGLISKDFSLKEFLEDGFMHSDDQQPIYRWFHLPVNNMRWAKQCAEKIGFVLDDLAMSVRPALHGGIHIPLHARHMQTGCNRHTQTGKLYRAFLPYLNVDYCKDVQSLTKTYARLGKSTESQPSEHNASRREILEHKLLPQMRQDTSGNFLHPRRTLDQFYYTSLTDTTDRDGDQTISKWTGQKVGADGRTHAVDDSLMLMVDQLWIWALDRRTVLTCFPSHDALEFENHNRFFEVLCNFAGQTHTVIDFVVHTMVQATKSENHRPVVDHIGIYRWATSKKTARHATYFAEFHHEYCTGDATFDDERELNLALEVADIIDELKMIKSVLSEQKVCFNAAQYHTPGHINKVFSAGQEYLDSSLSNVMEIKTEAEETYKALLDLLDLKTKTASLAEARSTTKQGQAVMLFTIVTIIFLPLSFFTSYFGQNVSEITGDDANPTAWDVWKVGTPITVMIIFVALLFAYHIMRPDSWLWFWKRGRRAPRAEQRGRMPDIEMS